MVVAQGNPRGRAALPADPVERGRPDAPEASSIGRRVPRAAREDERRGGPRTRTRRFAERRPIRVAPSRGPFVRDPWGSRGAEVARGPRKGHRWDAQRGRGTERGPEEVHRSGQGGKRVAIRPRPPQSLSRRPAIRGRGPLNLVPPSDGTPFGGTRTRTGPPSRSKRR